MTRVVYWNNIPAPYMVDRFNAVARRGALDLEAWFSARTKSDRSWVVDESSWKFSSRYLPAVGDGARRFAVPTPLLRDAPEILVSLYAGLDFVIASELARKRGARIAFRVVMTYDTWVQRRWWKEAIKSYILPRADGILVEGDDGRAFAQRYGVRDDRIHLVPQAIDFNHFEQGVRRFRAQRGQLRSELGVRGVTFVYVGRLLTGKGLTYLLDAFRDLQRQNLGEVSLLLVGDGRDEGLLRDQARSQGLENVVFCNFQHYDVLPRFYAAADVFVFPTLGDAFGIVVLEAMACGLPVIATTSSGEISDRVVDGVNGFLVPPADPRPLLRRMIVLAQDGDLRQRMGRASVDRVSGQTPDLWAHAFEQAIEKIRGMRPVRRCLGHPATSSSGLPR